MLLYCFLCTCPLVHLTWIKECESRPSQGTAVTREPAAQVKPLTISTLFFSLQLQRRCLAPSKATFLVSTVGTLPHLHIRKCRRPPSTQHHTLTPVGLRSAAVIMSHDFTMGNIPLPVRILSATNQSADNSDDLELTLTNCQSHSVLQMLRITTIQQSHSMN